MSQSPTSTWTYSRPSTKNAAAGVNYPVFASIFRRSTTPKGGHPIPKEQLECEMLYVAPDQARRDRATGSDNTVTSQLNCPRIQIVNLPYTISRQGLRGRGVYIAEHICYFRVARRNRHQGPLRTRCHQPVTWYARLQRSWETIDWLEWTPLNLANATPSLSDPRFVDSSSRTKCRLGFLFWRGS
ncbi:hypothetical protein CC78DRAFT_577519 [Lojkania enalia]|uniref:Uncharacterized protein n=1 Tax=Lojkania enalia TaxID=147567 RepID=A0A9P4N5F3_9PLEO|nr:hypothetical protein CC78DRAFT_577519 [Didymosphaeria enalia]